MIMASASGQAGQPLNPDKLPPETRNWRDRWRTPLMLLGLVVLFIGLLYAYITGGRYQSTDNAYVRIAQVTVSSDVSARVMEITVRDNQAVLKDSLLVRLDDRPFLLAVEEARAQVAAARMHVAVLKANYRQQQEELAAALSVLQWQQREFTRQLRLLAADISSQAQMDQITQTHDEAQIRVNKARQQLEGVEANLAGDPKINPDQHPDVQQAQARLDNALLNLSFTQITAPAEGIVTRVEQLQVGDYINRASPAFALLVTGNIWIEANFKEDQLTYMRPGQSVQITLDTYPDITLQGQVESLSPGTGSQFSLLPPENATGNWVKVVQRLPVRIRLNNLDPALRLKTGLSASVTVDTEHRHPFLASLSNKPQK